MYPKRLKRFVANSTCPANASTSAASRSTSGPASNSNSRDNTEMGRREEAIKLLKDGNPPSKIADLMGVSRNTVMGYLNQKVGERDLSRYEIVLSMDRQSRDAIDRLVAS